MDQYKSAVDEIKARQQLIDDTARQMKKSLSTKSRKTWLAYRKYQVAMVSILLFVMVMVFYPKEPLPSEIIDPDRNPDINQKVVPKESNVSIKYIDILPELPNISVKEHIPSQEEILENSDTILYGQVSDIKYLEVSMEDNTVYYSLISLEVINSFKRSLEQGTSIDVLTFATITNGSILDQIKVGDKGFFMIKRLENEDYAKYEGENRVFSDLSDYSLVSDKGSILLEKGETYLDPYSIYTSLPDDPTYEDIETLITNISNNQ